MVESGLGSAVHVGLGGAGGRALGCGLRGEPLPFPFLKPGQGAYSPCITCPGPLWPVPWWFLHLGVLGPTLAPLVGWSVGATGPSTWAMDRLQQLPRTVVSPSHMPLQLEEELEILRNRTRVNELEKKVQVGAALAYHPKPVSPVPESHHCICPPLPPCCTKWPPCWPM